MTTTINASNSGSGGLIQTADASGVLALQTAGTTAVTIDTSQRVGIGTTSPNFQVSFGANIGKTLAVFENAGTSVYGIGMGGAGTGGDPYRTKLFSNGTENACITDGGNVGIGTTSPSYKLDVSGAASATPVTNGIVRILTTGSNPPTGYGGGLLFTQVNSGGTNQDYASITGSRVNSSANNKVDLVFSTGDPTGSVAVAERMRLNTSGQLLIGATTANSSQSKLELKSPANTAVTLYMLKATQVEVNMGFNSSDSNFYINSGSTTIGASGVYLTNNGNSWSSVSDERMKTIVAPIENASAKVATLRTVIGYFNNDTKQTLRPFLIAQDVQAVLPEAVSVQDVETGTLGMSYTDTIPLLVAAIKEQQALITSLTARIAALEGTPA